jgi:hypothetical protein
MKVLVKAGPLKGCVVDMSTKQAGYALADGWAEVAVVETTPEVAPAGSFRTFDRARTGADVEKAEAAASAGPEEREE